MPFRPNSRHASLLGLRNGIVASGISKSNKTSRPEGLECRCSTTFEPEWTEASLSRWLKAASGGKRQLSENR